MSSGKEEQRWGGEGTQCPVLSPWEGAGLVQGPDPEREKHRVRGVRQLPREDQGGRSKEVQVSGNLACPGGLCLYMWPKFLWFIQVQSCSVLGADAQTRSLYAAPRRQECCCEPAAGAGR